MFGYHPANLAFRFLLEIAALVALGIGSYNLAAGPLAWILAICAPALAAVVWGVFAVPGDESRSGEAPVPVPGAVRLLIELGVFGLAVLLLAGVSPIAAAILGVAVAIHYLLSVDRIRWLFSH